jgi:hypothetical protein
MSFLQFTRLISKQLKDKAPEKPSVFELTPTTINDLIALIGGRKETITLKSADGQELVIKFSEDK